ncbi:MAG TPA: hypothetical protein VLL82_10135 [Mycobacterium sp.]|nr:hypothetical protein [Mycobacterium sp.]
MNTLIHPAATVVAIRTNGYRVNQVTVACPFCRGQHTYEWFGELDGLRQPTCGAHASYIIRIDARARMDHMRTEFPGPDGVVGLVPLHISYAFECDGADDIIGVVVDTTMGSFALWLEADNAVQLAGQLVGIVENREVLRERYLQRELEAQP